MLTIGCVKNCGKFYFSPEFIFDCILKGYFWTCWVSIFIWCIYGEQTKYHFSGYYYLLGHRLAWLVVIEIMCMCKISGNTLILRGVHHLWGRIQLDPCKFGKSINCWIYGVSPNLLRRSCFAFSFVGHMVYKFWTLSSSYASFYGWTLPSCRGSLLVEIERFVTGGELTRSILGTVPSGAMLELWCRKHCRFVLLGTIPSHRNTFMKTVLFFSPFGNNTVPIFFSK